MKTLFNLPYRNDLRKRITEIKMSYVSLQKRSKEGHQKTYMEGKIQMCNDLMRMI